MGIKQDLATLKTVAAQGSELLLLRLRVLQMDANEQMRGADCCCGGVAAGDAGGGAAGTECGADGAGEDVAVFWRGSGERACDVAVAVAHSTHLAAQHGADTANACRLATRLSSTFRQPESRRSGRG